MHYISTVNLFENINVDTTTIFGWAFQSALSQKLKVN
jgi:hypothetical protein